MCLGIPGQIVEIVDAEQMLAMVDVCGVKREVNLACVLAEAADAGSLIGRWTLVHVGFAMSLIDEQEAQKTLELLAEFGEMEEELAAIRNTGA
ncbi:HypC/HybG/HupF family hydrogenase formation chaperone [Marinobacterium arenosum]|uniref:HypC/HybG/HupF family hydrogenase formation chaperone n=1 Tax=Marinobacterium arenosum TaxID=2862496 RepID=UPI001C97323C|nr:HypC/HybG/HupF family hydrogenase formation chaperone [Marinobacterium arenosum]MBY4677389.1 HypC/HybG/HupF family hydrogenase formation chaperone [Marinobacterium arenosum]